MLNKKSSNFQQVKKAFRTKHSSSQKQATVTSRGQQQDDTWSVVGFV
jgi:hypothetical protein